MPVSPIAPQPPPTPIPITKSDANTNPIPPSPKPAPFDQVTPESLLAQQGGCGTCKTKNCDECGSGTKLTVLKGQGDKEEGLNIAKLKNMYLDNLKSHGGRASEASGTGGKLTVLPGDKQALMNELTGLLNSGKEISPKDQAIIKDTISYMILNEIQDLPKNQQDKVLQNMIKSNPSFGKLSEFADAKKIATIMNSGKSSSEVSTQLSKLSFQSKEGAQIAGRFNGNSNTMDTINGAIFKQLPKEAQDFLKKELGVGVNGGELEVSLAKLADEKFTKTLLKTLDNLADKYEHCLDESVVDAIDTASDKQLQMMKTNTKAGVKMIETAKLIIEKNDFNAKPPEAKVDLTNLSKAVSSLESLVEAKNNGKVNQFLSHTNNTNHQLAKSPAPVKAEANLPGKAAVSVQTTTTESSRGASASQSASTSGQAEGTVLPKEVIGKSNKQVLSSLKSASFSSAAIKTVATTLPKALPALVSAVIKGGELTPKQVVQKVLTQVPKEQVGAIVSEAAKETPKALPQLIQSLSQSRPEALPSLISSVVKNAEDSLPVIIKSIETAKPGLVSEVVTNLVKESPKSVALLVDSLQHYSSKDVPTVLNAVASKSPGSLPAVSVAIAKEAPQALPALVKSVVKEAPQSLPGVAVSVAKEAPEALPALVKSIAKEAPQSLSQVAVSVAKEAPESLPALVKSIASEKPQSLPTLTASIAKQSPDQLATVIKSVTPQSLANITVSIAKQSPEALPTVLNTIATQKPESLPNITAAISKSSPESLPALVKSIATTTPQALNTVIATVAKESPKSLPTLISLVGKESPQSLAQVAVSVAKESPGQLPQVIQSISKSNPEQVLATVSALVQETGGRKEATQSIKPLLSALSNSTGNISADTQNIATAIKTALPNLDKGSVTLISNTLQTTTSQVKNQFPQVFSSITNASPQQAAAVLTSLSTVSQNLPTLPKATQQTVKALSLSTLNIVPNQAQVTNALAPAALNHALPVLSNLASISTVVSALPAKTSGVIQQQLQNLGTLSAKQLPAAIQTIQSAAVSLSKSSQVIQETIKELPKSIQTIATKAMSTLQSLPLTQMASAFESLSQLLGALKSLPSPIQNTMGSLLAKLGSLPAGKQAAFLSLLSQVGVKMVNLPTQLQNVSVQILNKMAALPNTQMMRSMSVLSQVLSLPKQSLVKPFLNLLSQIMSSATGKVLTAALKGVELILNSISKFSPKAQEMILNFIQKFAGLDAKGLANLLVSVGTLMSKLNEAQLTSLLSSISSFSAKGQQQVVQLLAQLSSKLPAEQMKELLQMINKLSESGKLNEKELIALLKSYVDKPSKDNALLKEASLAASKLAGAAAGSEEVKLKRLKDESARQLRGKMVKNDAFTKAMLTMFNSEFSTEELEDVTGGLSDWESYLKGLNEEKEKEEQEERRKNRERFQEMLNEEKEEEREKNRERFQERVKELSPVA